MGERDVSDPSVWRYHQLRLFYDRGEIPTACAIDQIHRRSSRLESIQDSRNQLRIRRPRAG